MVGSYSEFCKFMGFKSKSYVNKLKKDGRLVFAGDKIDFEKSRALINQTSDISRDNVIDKIPVAEPVHTRSRVNTAESNPNKPFKEQYELARIARQAYDAKIKRLEFERRSGNLGSLDQIKTVGFEIGKIIKTRLATFAIRATPIVTNETSEKRNREYLLGEIENVMQEIVTELEQAKSSIAE